MNDLAQRITAAPVRKTVRVEADRARAFEVFTARMGAWWPKSHSINRGHPQKDVIIEPRQGGRWYERGEDGAECNWGRVLAWEPPARLMLSWHINSRFEPDTNVSSEVEVRFFVEGPKTTRVELEHRITAVDAEVLRTMVDAPNGWTALMASYSNAVSRS